MAQEVILSGFTHIFEEPEGYYAEKQGPKEEMFHRIKSPACLKVRLASSHPLWAHFLWNASKCAASYIDGHTNLVDQKTMLELGAGGALPSLVGAACGAKLVVATDYPDRELLDNIRHNVENSGIPKSVQSRILVKGYLWGQDTKPLLELLPEEKQGYDILILSDVLFNHSETHKLADCCCKLLNKTRDARILVFYSHHRPWLAHKDMEYFQLLKDAGVWGTRILQEYVGVMWEKDRGSARTALAYSRAWQKLDASDQVLGRLASRIACILLGKHKPIYHPSSDCGDYVIVTNCSQLKITGKKFEQKLYRKHTTRPGVGFKEITMERLVQKTSYAEILKRAVSGMLPKNRLRDKRLFRLKAYDGPQHSYHSNLTKVRQPLITPPPLSNTI